MVQDIIYKNILENMTDGVMTIDLNGRIITFNSSAESILGLNKKEVLGKTFAEVFFSLEGNDDFNQSILDAIYESNIIHHKVVEFKRKDSVITLSLTTSFLQEDRNGHIEKIGIIAVFSDITEIKKLRDKEAELTKELKRNHKKLQQAYLKLEESKRDLEIALKKVQFIRMTLTVLVVFFFLGIGVYIWNKSPNVSLKQASKSIKDVNFKTKNIKIITITPRPILSTISLTGNLEPLKLINIVSPFIGKVKDRFFNYGEYVKKGQILIKMDTSEIEIKYRSAKITYIKALQELERLETWKNSPEVKQARRLVTKARFILEAQKRRFQEAKRLYEKGIIPTDEYETAKQELKNAELDFIAAKDELKAILDKGNKQNIAVARIEMENAQIRLKELEDQLKKATIFAPVSGIVILPPSSDKDNSSKIAEKGVSFEQGEVMLCIGDMEGISVKAYVDEVNINKIKKGQRVIITGDAFPNIKLIGKIDSISSQAKISSNEGVPSFEVVVTVRHLTPQQRKKLCIGMSANLEVVVYKNPKALIVPIKAVSIVDSKRFLRILDKKTGKIKKIQVKTGITTLDSVEILSGLHPGDQVVIDSSGQL